MKLDIFLKQYLEGGNLSWKDKKGKENFVQKVDLTKINRSEFVEEVSRFLKEINTLYKSKYKSDLIKEENISNPKFYSGSTRPMMDLKNIDDELYTKYKKTVGDVDFQVDDRKKDQVRELLLTFPKLTNFEVVHARDAGNQIITAVKSKKFDIIFQTDFEFVEFDNEKDEPSEWSLFAHASEWDDITNGAKGFLKQKLLKSILHADKLATNATVVERQKRGDKVSKNETIHQFAYSVDKGFREKFKKIKYQGEDAFEVIPASEAKYSKNLSDFFTKIFPDFKGKINGLDLASFTKVIKFMNKQYSTEKNQAIFLEFFKDLFGKGAQQVDRNDDEDKATKLVGVELFMKEIPTVKITDTMNNLIDTYYGDK